jgi:hypothetical protein
MSDEETALRFLKAHGYVIKLRSASIKYTFEADADLLKEFRACQKALGLKIKEAFHIAMREWIDKHSRRK